MKPPRRQWRWPQLAQQSRLCSGAGPRTPADGTWPPRPHERSDSTVQQAHEAEALRKRVEKEITSRQQTQMSGDKERDRAGKEEKQKMYVQQERMQQRRHKRKELVRVLDYRIQITDGIRVRRRKTKKNGYVKIYLRFTQLQSVMQELFSRQSWFINQSDFGKFLTKI